MINKKIALISYILTALILFAIMMLARQNLSNQNLVWLGPVSESLFITGSGILVYLLLSRAIITNDQWNSVIGLAFLSTIIPTIAWLLAWHNIEGQSFIPTPLSTHFWLLYLRDTLFVGTFIYYSTENHRKRLRLKSAAIVILLLSSLISVLMITPPFLPVLTSGPRFLPLNSFISFLMFAIYSVLIIYNYYLFKKSRNALLFNFMLFLLIYALSFLGFGYAATRFDYEWYVSKAINLVAFGILIGLLISEYTGYFVDSLVARSLQLSLAPKIPAVDWLDIDAQYRPAMKQAAIGGDWYDVIQPNDDQVIIIVGDAIGKGIDAISTMTEAKFLLRGYLIDGWTIEQSLIKVNNYLVKYLNQEEFVTLAIGLIDKRAKKLHYTLAGHLPPILATDKAYAFLSMPKPKLPLGIARNTEYPLSEVPVSRDNLLAFYSDGIIEARTGNNFFGDKGLADFLLENQKFGIEQANQRLINTLTANWQIIDDMTSVIIKVNF